MPAAALLKFVPGFDPQVIALKFAEGKPMPANQYHGEQLMFTLTSEQKWFAPPSVGKKLLDMRIQPGEEFSVCKTETRRGTGRIVDVEISAIVPPYPAPPAPPPPSPIYPKEPAAPPQETAGQGGSSRISPPNGSTTRSALPASAAPAASAATAARSAPMNGNGETGAEQLARCYRDAVDIAILTVEHGKKMGLSLAPCFEDIRCMAAVMTISEQQGGRR